MRRRLSVTYCLLVVLAIAGCSNDSTVSSQVRPDAPVARPIPPPPPPPPPPPASKADATGITGSEPPAAMAKPGEPSATPATPPRLLPAVVQQKSIQLTAGVALAQTGPEGTLMMFSVDYEVVQGDPNAMGYVWVIERARGNSAKVDVKLKPNATLTTAIGGGWRSEDGPFHCHLEDRMGNRVSESIEMHEPGT
jgi:hypothetical protein